MIRLEDVAVWHRPPGMSQSEFRAATIPDLISVLQSEGVPTVGESAVEVEAIAEAVFDLEANPQRWSTTTESMRVIYRASIRKALTSVRVAGGEPALNVRGVAPPLVEQGPNKPDAAVGVEKDGER